jgi:hypothetical protein
MIACRGVEQWLVDGFCDRSGTKVGGFSAEFLESGEVDGETRGGVEIGEELGGGEQAGLFVCVAGCQAECHYASFDVFLGAICR